MKQFLLYFSVVAALLAFVASNVWLLERWSRTGRVRWIVVAIVWFSTVAALTFCFVDEAARLP